MPKLSRNTKLLGFASFLVDVSSEMVYSILPFFLTNILLAPAFVIGLMESLGEFSVSVSGFLSGLYSDRIGKRKRLILGGYSLSAVFKAVLVFLTSWPQLVLFRVVERIGKGVRDVPRDALISLSEEKGNLGKAFGFRRMLDNTGAILGPLIATILLALLADTAVPEEVYRTIFAIAVVPAVLAVACLLFLKDRSSEQTPVKRIMSEVFRISQFKQFLAAGFVFSLGNISLMFFLLRANDFLPLVFIPVLYLSYNVFYTIFSMPAGLLSDRFGAKKPLILGMLLFLASLLLIIFMPSVNIFFISFAILGLFMSIAETAPQVLISRSVDPRYYASAIGAYKGVTGASSLPANLIAGGLYGIVLFNSPATFVFCTITTIAGILLLAFLVKE